MIQALDGRSFYGPDMRDARQLRLPQRLQELVAEDPMRRSGEFLMACTLLVLTLPLMLITALAIKMGEFWPRVRAARADWPERPAISNF